MTIICLGPLTNVAGAFRRDPGLPGQIGQMVIMGGALAGGNVTPAAEFNIYCDPQAARDVFRQPTTMTLIPLDVTSQVVMTFGESGSIAARNRPRSGKFLRTILPFAFRTHRQEYGLEGMYLHDTVGFVAALHPELFTTERMAADVETQGELTTGAIVFDRRPVPQWRHNLYVATKVDVAGVMDVVIRGIAEAARASRYQACPDAVLAEPCGSCRKRRPMQTSACAAAAYRKASTAGVLTNLDASPTLALT